MQMLIEKRHFLDERVAVILSTPSRCRLLPEHYWWYSENYASACTAEWPVGPKEYCGKPKGAKTFGERGCLAWGL